MCRGVASIDRGGSGRRFIVRGWGFNQRLQQTTLPVTIRAGARRAQPSGLLDAGVRGRIMPVRLSKTRSQLVGALAAATLGFGLFLIGGRLVVYEHLLAEPVKVGGSIVDSGQTRSSHGGNVNFIRYEFVDKFGETRDGTSSRYSGQKGESIQVEYSARFPSIHRVAGEGKMSRYEWRWPVAGFGLFIHFAGVHWWRGLRRDRHPPNEPQSRRRGR